MLPPRKVVAIFAAKLVCALAFLMAPWPGLGDAWCRAFASVGNVLVEGREFDSGARLSFVSGAEQAPDGESKTFAWESTLVVRGGDGRQIQIPIDVRALAYLPIAAFVALVVALPIRDRRRRLFIFMAGMGLLVPLTIWLMALPLFPFLGGAGPIRVFDLGPALRSAFEIAYRALVAPPGMTYAIPALLAWTLLAFSDRNPSPREKPC